MSSDEQPMAEINEDNLEEAILWGALEGRRLELLRNMARERPDLFEIRDDQVYVRPGKEDEPCPCCGLPLSGSPLPRADA